MNAPQLCAALSEHLDEQLHTWESDGKLIIAPNRIAEPSLAVAYMAMKVFIPIRGSYYRRTCDFALPPGWTMVLCDPPSTQMPGPLPDPATLARERQLALRHFGDLDGARAHVFMSEAAGFEPDAGALLLLGAPRINVPTYHHLTIRANAEQGKHR